MTTSWSGLFRYAMALVSLGIAVTAGLAAWQLNRPLDAPAVFPFSETYYARSVASTDDRTRIDWAARAISVAPLRAENWVLMAYAYQSADHILSPRVLEALRQSYRVAPLSPDAHDWRLAYIYSNWSHMPPDLRSFATREAQNYVTVTAGLKYLGELDKTLQDRDGRVALGIVVISQRSAQRVKWLAARQARRSGL